MHFTIAFTVLSSLASFIGALATPIEARGASRFNCHPNFEGVGVSITNSATEWGTSPGSWPNVPIINFSHRNTLGMTGQADWHVEQDGQHPTHYLIKDVSHPHLYASVRDNKLLLLHRDHNDRSQLWRIRCDECRTDVAQIVEQQVGIGCNITNVAYHHQCATTDRVNTNAIFLGDCNGSDEHNYDFWSPQRGTQNGHLW